MIFFGSVYPWQLYFYYPQEKINEGQFLIGRLSGAKKLDLAVLKPLYESNDLGEIDPNYRGFQEMARNFVLAAGLGEKPYGFCVFVIERSDLVQIDIVLTAPGWRRKGLGRFLLGALEQACLPGTVIYVDQVTEIGRKFFMSCGFTKDVNLFKIAGRPDENCFPAQNVIAWK